MIDVHTTTGQVCCRRGDLGTRGRAGQDICHIDELLQPKQPLLAALCYLFLLHQRQSQDATPIVVKKKS